MKFTSFEKFYAAGRYCLLLVLLAIFVFGTLAVSAIDGAAKKESNNDRRAPAPSASPSPDITPTPTPGPAPGPEPNPTPSPSPTLVKVVS